MICPLGGIDQLMGDHLFKHFRDQTFSVNRSVDIKECRNIISHKTPRPYNHCTQKDIPV